VLPISTQGLSLSQQEAALLSVDEQRVSALRAKKMNAQADKLQAAVQRRNDDLPLLELDRSRLPQLLPRALERGHATENGLTEDRDGAESLSRLPTLSWHAVANWIDPGTPPVPLAIGDAVAPPAIQQVVDVMFACATCVGDQQLWATVLTRRLQSGLEKRRGRYLSDREWAFYLTLTTLIERATGRMSGGVCRRCRIVLDNERSQTCSDCKRKAARTPSSARVAVKSKADPRTGHTVARITKTEIVVSSWRPRRGTPERLTYERICEGEDCRTRFESHSAARRYCARCATPASRTARARARVGASKNLQKR
jgi:hypothetical protein